MIHELPYERRTLHGHFSRDLPPVVTIDPGDSVAFACPNAGWRVAPGETFEPRDGELDAGHALAGPIEVRGARAGRTLVVHIDEVRPGTFGETFGPDTRVEWILDADAATGADDRGATVRLAPFLGVIGMPPDEDGVHSTGPPRRWGGNIDCKELVAGATLYLPVSIDGAHVSAGDGHAAQGDGEVGNSAVETSLKGEIQVVLHKGMRTGWPRAETPTHYMTMGLDPDLNQAAKIATREMLNFIVATKGLPPEDVLMVLSAALDLHVTQIVDGTKGIHAMLPKAIFQNR